MFTLVLRTSALVLLGAGAAWAQAGSPSGGRPSSPAPQQPPWRLGGQVIADYYAIARHEPRPAREQEDPAADQLAGQQGFWFRRLYLTYDHTLTPRLSTRLRLEARSPGDFVTDARLEPILKDAYLRLDGRRLSLVAGLAPTVSVGVSETVWGLRSVEKTPLDLWRLDSSRDLGVSVSATLGTGGRWRYELQAGNGAGVSAETVNAKTVRGAISRVSLRGLSAQVYADRQGRRGGDDRVAVAALVAWRGARWRAGALYARQRRPDIDRVDAPAGRSRRTVDLVSLFGVAGLHPRVNLFGRFDRVGAALPEALTIDYLPVSPAANPLLLVGGLDIEVEGPLRVQPHVQVLSHGAEAGRRPGPTVIARLTAALAW